MPKSRQSKPLRHDPLYKSIEEGSGHLRAENKSRNKRQTKQNADAESEYLDSASTRKILEIARQQQIEIEEEDNLELQNSKTVGGNIIIEQYAESFDGFSDEEAQWNSDAEKDLEEFEEQDWNYSEEDANPEDLEIFGRYVAEQRGASSNEWADKIMSKLHQLETTGRVDMTGGIGEDDFQDEGEEEGVMLPPKVIAVYTQVGELLSRYRSGKLPRAFKIIPTLKNWRDVLYVTNPPEWSNQAIYEATKLFITSMPTHQTPRFIEEVLLPRFREQVETEKSVNYHVYRAMKKALFKPQAFFKGLLFPLLKDMHCTSKEAIILSSVLSKTSIPLLHSAAALLYVAEFPYNPANTIIVKTLLDKKYALPYKVVDAVVFHFVDFRNYQNPLPLVWHQSLLCFAQRYKNDITTDQRDALMAVARIHTHHAVTPEIRRELLAGEPRMA